MKALGMMTIATCLVSMEAAAGPVVREAAGANAAAIQAAVDQFRTDLGGANNGNTAGGSDVTLALLGCLGPGTLGSGGATFRCPLPRALVSPGDHVLQVEVGFADQSRRRNAVRWTVVANTEP